MHSMKSTLKNTIEVSSSNSLFVEHSTISLMLTVTLLNSILVYFFYTFKDTCRDGLALSSQTVGSLLRTPWTAKQLKNYVNIAPF